MSQQPHTVNVTVWSEFLHERKNPEVAKIYPDGLHETIAGFLNAVPGIIARTAWLEQPEHGLNDDVLGTTDVLIWWGHLAHDAVSDKVVKHVQRRVLAGMGLIILHSAHFSKIFKTLMGTTCTLKWREADDEERVWNLAPNHPITRGIPDSFVIPREEMYGERFGIPDPDELLFLSWFSGGEVFRSGATWRRGLGKIFYFRPGHETFPTYHQSEVQRVISNAVHWAAPIVNIPDAWPNLPQL